MHQVELAQGNGFQEIDANGKPFFDPEDEYQEYEASSAEYRREPKLEGRGTEESQQQVTPEDVDDIFLCPFIEDIYEYARHCILTFFEGKSHYNGGDIPLDEVTSDDHVQMVINTTVCAASQAAYNGTTTATWIDKKSPQEGVPGEDVRILLSIYNECSTLNIPKYFAGGIALLCLQYCEGVQVPYHKIEEYLAEEFDEKWYLQYKDEDGNLVEDHNPNKEDLEGAEKEEEFCLCDVLVDYGIPK